MNIDYTELKRLLSITSLEKDIILLEDISSIPYTSSPEVLTNSTSIIVISGYINIGIDLNRHKIAAPSFISIMPGQITQYFEKSDDFKGLVISSSNKFNDYLEISVEKSLSVFFGLKNRPYITLKESELNILTDSFYMLKTVLNEPENTYKHDIAKHLIIASFYMVLNLYSKYSIKEEKEKTTQEAIFDSFYKYVQLYYRQERELRFYADKLCITPKYLSSVIKNTSGKSANDWIDSLVVLEAKALLKSSRMTVQQVSDKLNFPSQSFFGKYFKRLVGISPMAYKKQ